MSVPTFKEILQQDIKQTFLNPYEFGEPHDIDGKEMIAVIDDLEQVEREKKMKSHADAIFARQIFIYVAAEDFGPLPAQNRLLKLDGKTYKVVDVTDEAGIYGITLEANRAK